MDNRQDFPLPPSTQALKRALGSFATGVIIAATWDLDERPCGLTINAFTSVSLSPPLLLISIAQDALSHGVFARAQGFSLTVLEGEQHSVSKAFSTRSAHKFSHGTWKRGAHGYPLLEGGIAWFECTKERAIDVEDHTLFLGRVLWCDAQDGRPLLYWRKAYHTVGDLPPGEE